MVRVAPTPHRCERCGEPFGSYGDATRHVTEEHGGYGRIAMVLGENPTGRGKKTAAEATPAGPSFGPVGAETEGAPIPPRADSPPSPPNWHEAQKAAWVAGCIDTLQGRWPDHELDEWQRGQLLLFFGHLEYGDATRLAKRAATVCEQFPSVAELEHLQRSSNRSVAASAFRQMRKTLKGAR